MREFKRFIYTMYSQSAGHVIATSFQLCRSTSVCLSEEAGRPLLAVNDEEASELIGREVCLLFDKGAHGINLGLP